jgi:hypothetical protein
MKKHTQRRKRRQSKMKLRSGGKFKAKRLEERLAR